MTDKIEEIRVRHRYAYELPNDLATLLVEVDRLTSERDEARAEVRRLLADARAISAIAHSGGSAALSEHEALIEIRRRTLSLWSRKAKP